MRSMGSLRGELSYPPNDIHLPEGVKRALRTIISDTSSTRSVSAGHALLTVHVFGDSACCTALEVRGGEAEQPQSMGIFHVQAFAHGDGKPPHAVDHCNLPTTDALNSINMALPVR